MMTTRVAVTVWHDFITTSRVQTQESEMLLTLAVRALATLKRYLSWIDIRLVSWRKCTMR